MKINKKYLRVLLGASLGLFVVASEVDAQRGGGRGGGSRGSSRSSAARSSGSGSVRNASSRTSTPSRSSQQHAASRPSSSVARSASGAPQTPTARPTPTVSSPRAPSSPWGPTPQNRPSTTPNRTPSSGSSNSRAGLAAATGVAAGAAGATAVNNRRESRTPGYGSVNQSERLQHQVRTDPTSRRAVAERVAADPRARQAALDQLQADPAARAAARTYATGAPTTRAEAAARMTAGGRNVVTTLPAYARPIRVPHRHGRYHRRYRNLYWTGSRWYYPYYYGGYVYYEEIDAPLGAEVDELSEDDYEVVVIDGEEFYLLNGTYYQVTDDGFVVVDPYADDTLDAEQQESALALEDSKALQVLMAMGEYVQSLDNFQVDSIEIHDNVADSGERFQLTNERRLFVAKPDKARSQTVGDGSNRQFWYDGKQVTVYSGVLKTFSTVDAPNTLAETVASMSSTYGLAFPLADLLFSDIYYAMTEGVMSADYVGAHQAGGVTCDHLAFSQEAIDWQIWVTQGDQPTPRKIQISYKLEPGIPLYTSEIIKWIPIDEQDDAYRFTPPEDAIEIEMEPL